MAGRIIQIRPRRISPSEVYGGVPKKEQLPALQRGSPILVATPGRLNDFLELLGRSDSVGTTENNRANS